MSRTLSPTVRRRRLARVLRGLREAAGLTLDTASKQAALPRATLGKLETADLKRLRLTDLDSLARLYAVDDKTRLAMHQLAKDAEQRGWWSKYRDVFSPGSLPDFEAEASVIRTYEAQVVPGLLQTREYACAVFTGTNAFAEDEVKRHVDARMERQYILKHPYPPEYAAIIDEAVLRRPAGGRQAMVEQLHHLAELATLRHVTIHVLPFAAGMHAANLGGFMIMDFPDDADPAIAYAETPASILFVEEEEDIRRNDAMWREALNASLTVAQSIDFIEEVATSLESDQ
ncbi:helix-turn-helix domain-containing protein [Streptomonospora wellingtoniae]|uniref:Helix-turn-helix transcriptional regulator n=1 Tax=Streptomonospora wellingtoniae TaxID=3075544 RepID=A0ABU2KN35_9ACTN|nr:helix-turn-helix transcriptional regulator [Streptomonospora sp. DSM 45055]MDT0300679.1 helix-turn-helix transcriptional regulator [Streptomonospora sp. DSM 45055]